jgi:hypothetical protein
LTTLFFTVCSLSQYPRALALGKSLRRHHPDSPFFIGLADRPDRLPDETHPFPVVGLEALGIPDFGEFVQRYTWLEVLHAARPFFARFFLDNTPAADALVFLGPESWVTSPLTALEQALETASVVLIPQRLTPPAGAHWPPERQFLRDGVYQADAWGLRRGAESDRFLAWWSERLRTKGWLRPCEGFALDQGWLNLVPAFFDSVVCLKEAGYGVGYVNADERPLRPDGNQWWIHQQPLALVNFRGLNPSGTDWQPHLTRQRWSGWRELLTAYRGDVPRQLPVRQGAPSFGRPYVLNTTPLSRYRLICPLLRLVRWIDTVPLSLRG